MYASAQPKKKKLPFIVAALVLIVAFTLTLRYGVMHHETGAYLMIGGLVAVGAYLVYKLRK